MIFTLQRQISGGFFGPTLPTLKSDIIYGRSPTFQIIVICEKMQFQAVKNGKIKKKQNIMSLLFSQMSWQPWGQVGK